MRSSTRFVSDVFGLDGDVFGRIAKCFIYKPDRLSTVPAVFGGNLFEIFFHSGNPRLYFISISAYDSYEYFTA